MRQGWWAAALGAVAVTLVPGSGLPAQGWTVDLQAGQASFEAVPSDVSSTSVTLGARHTLDERFFQGLVALPVGSDDMAWAVLGAADRLAFGRGRLAMGLDVSGHAHGQRDLLADVSGWGLRGEALPFLSASAGPVVAEVRSGGSWYYAGVNEGNWSRNLWISDLRVTAVPGGAPVRMTGTVRQVSASEETYAFVGATVGARVGRSSLQASVGDWVSGLGGDFRSTGWGAAAAVTLSPSMDVWTSLRSEPFDPVFLAPSRTNWGIGVSYRPGVDRRTPAPRAGPEVREGGTVVIRIPLSAASAPPSVAGDFTGWEPVPMHRRGTEWRAEVSPPPGVYRYAFRTASGEWFVPEGVPGRRDDGMGGWVAVLIVP